MDSGKKVAGAAKGERERIESDVAQFRRNVLEVRETRDNAGVVGLARRYCDDTEYFLKKKDYVTAFGCINYAHGLLDALRRPWEKK